MQGFWFNFAKILVLGEDIKLFKQNTVAALPRRDTAFAWVFFEIYFISYNSFRRTAVLWATSILYAGVTAHLSPHISCSDGHAFHSVFLLFILQLFLHNPFSNLLIFWIYMIEFELGGVGRKKNKDHIVCPLKGGKRTSRFFDKNEKSGQVWNIHVSGILQQSVCQPTVVPHKWNSEIMAFCHYKIR